MTKRFLGDTALLTGRSLRHIARSPDTIITTAVMPIAGILLITIASGISYTAYRLFLDMQSGIFERFQSMPITRSSVLWAHMLTSLVANVISLVVVVLMAL